MSADARVLGKPTPWSEIKGFNYQPSYGSSGFELWRQFDAAQIAVELDRGVKYFPRINALRWWLSADAFDRDRDAFARNFDTALQLASERGLAVIPVLFNRWHSPVCDWGGVYLDHFVPGSGWIIEGGEVKPGERLCGEFVERIVGEHAGDERILAWDICNEPFCYGASDLLPAGVFEAELAWLTRMTKACRAQDPATPICIGIESTGAGGGVDGLRRVEPLCDVLAIRGYFLNVPDIDALLDGHEQVAAESGKSLFASEACWGAFNDAERVQQIRYSLGKLSERKIGWFAYVLHHSLVIDAHHPEHGPINEDVGPLHFIEADGSLRPGHEVFNEF